MSTLTRSVFEEECPPEPDDYGVVCENCGTEWGCHRYWLCPEADEEWVEFRGRFFELPRHLRFTIPEYKKILSGTNDRKVEAKCTCGLEILACAGCFDAPTCPYRQPNG